MYLMGVQFILLFCLVVTVVALINGWVDGQNVPLHIVDIIALVVTRFANVHPLFTVHFNVMGLEIVFIGAPAGL